MRKKKKSSQEEMDAKLDAWLRKKGLKQRKEDFVRWRKPSKPHVL